MAGPMTLEIRLVLNAAGVQAGGKQAQKTFQGTEAAVKKFASSVTTSLQGIEKHIQALSAANTSRGITASEITAAIVAGLQKQEVGLNRVASATHKAKMTTLGWAVAQRHYTTESAKLATMGATALESYIQKMRMRNAELKNTIILAEKQKQAVSQAQYGELEGGRMLIRVGEQRLTELRKLDRVHAEVIQKMRTRVKQRTQEEIDSSKRLAAAHAENQRRMTAIHKRETERRRAAERQAEAARQAALERERLATERLWHSMLRYTTVGLTFAMGLQRAGDATVNRMLLPAISAFGEYEEKMVRIGFLLGDYSGEKYRQATTFIQDYAAKSLFYIEQVQNALTQMLQSGLDFGQATGAMDAVYHWSLLSGQLEDTRETVRLLISTYNQFKKSTPGLEDLYGKDPGAAFSKIGDQLAFMTQKTIFEPGEMGALMRTVRGTASLMNIPLNEMLAVAGAVRGGGLQPADTGHSLNIFVRRIANLEKLRSRFGAKDVRDYLSKLGLTPEMVVKAEAASGRPMDQPIRRAMSAQTIGSAMSAIGLDYFDQKGKFVGLNEAVIRTVESLNKLESQQAKVILATTLFGQQGMVAVKMVEDFSYKSFKGAEALREFNRDIQQSNGYLQEFAEKRLANFEAKLKKVDAVLKTINLQIGAILGGALSPLLDMLHPLLQGITQFNNEYPMVTQGIVFIVAALGLMSLVLGTVGVALFGFVSMMSLTLFFTKETGHNLMQFDKVLGKLYDDLVIMLDAMLPFNLSMAKLGTILKFGVIGVLAAAVIYLTNLGGAADWVNDKIQSVRIVFAALQEYFSKGYITNGTMAALLGFGSDRANILGWFEDILYAVDWIKAVGSGVWDGLREGLRGLHEPFREIWGVLGEIGTIILEAFGGLFSIGPNLRQTDGHFAAIHDTVLGVVRVMTQLLVIPIRMVGYVASLVGWFLQFDAVRSVLRGIVMGMIAWWVWSRLVALWQDVLIAKTWLVWAAHSGAMGSAMRAMSWHLMFFQSELKSKGAWVAFKTLLWNCIGQIKMFAISIWKDAIGAMRAFGATMYKALVSPTALFIGQMLVLVLTFVSFFGVFYLAFNMFADSIERVRLAVRLLKLDILEMWHSIPGPMRWLAEKMLSAVPGSSLVSGVGNFMMGDTTEGMTLEMRRSALNADRMELDTGGGRARRFMDSGDDLTSRLLSSFGRDIGLDTYFRDNGKLDALRGSGLGVDKENGRLLDYFKNVSMPIEQAGLLESTPDMKAIYSDADIEKLNELNAQTKVQYGATPRIGKMSVKNELTVNAEYKLTPDEMDRIIRYFEQQIRSGSLNQSLAE